MSSHNEIINEINLKYLTLEAEVDKKLEKVKREEEKLANLGKNNFVGTSSTNAIKILSYEEALTRNVNLLKSVEMAKARLRSRSTFSPIEQILEKAIENYQKDLEATTKGARNLETIENSDVNPTMDSEPVYDII